MTINKTCKEYQEFLTTKSYKCVAKKHYLSQGIGSNILPYYKNELSQDISKQNVINKTAHLSQFRNILTEAISNVTRENVLKKGESVELTLEIELVKSENNTPTNSLVEVTILQHNKRNSKNKKNLIHMSTNKIPSNENIDTLIGKPTNKNQRNWFSRIINNNQDQEDPILCYKYLKNKVEENKNKHECRATENQMICFDASKNYKMKADNNEKKINFVTVLPENTAVNDDLNKDHQRVSQKDPNERSKYSNTKYNPKVSKKDSKLVRKISNIHLPAKILKKQSAVNTELTALKELNKINHVADKKIKRKKKIPVHNLEKLVGNIQVERMEFSNNDNDHSVQCKSYFEPTMNKNKRKCAEILKNKTNFKYIKKSYSDTCIQYQSQESAYATQNNSNSISDSNPLNRSTESASSTNDTNKVIIGDSLQNSTNKNKFKHRRNKKKKDGRGDAKPNSRHKSNNEHTNYKGEEKSVHKKRSLIHWNGKSIEINKKIKKKIEMLILNELENLALKEGMECDVTPLPSTANSLSYVKSIEKVSSFMCELDLSDAKIRKNKKSLDSKYKMKLSNEKLKKIKSKHMQCTSTVKSNKTHQTVDRKCSSNINNSNYKAFNCNIAEFNSDSFTTQEKPPTTNSIQDTTNNLEIKYLNLNIKSSSPELHNGIFKSPTATKSSINTMNSDLLFERKKRSDEIIFAKGFAKRITSNDSTWYNFLSRKTSSEKRNKQYMIETYSEQTSELQNSFITSKESENRIEIELNIQDLELLLKEAKDVHKADTIFIYTNCNNCKNTKYKKQKKYTSKNSSSYTNLLLAKASKKLVKYSKAH